MWIVFDLLLYGTYYCENLKVCRWLINVCSLPTYKHINSATMHFWHLKNQNLLNRFIKKRAGLRLSTCLFLHEIKTNKLLVLNYFRIDVSATIVWHINRYYHEHNHRYTGQCISFTLFIICAFILNNSIVVKYQCIWLICTFI